MFTGDNIYSDSGLDGTYIHNALTFGILQDLYLAAYLDDQYSVSGMHPLEYFGKYGIAHERLVLIFHVDIEYILECGISLLGEFLKSVCRKDYALTDALAASEERSDYPSRYEHSSDEERERSDLRIDIT